ncbi:Uncharacterised protein [Citrobacter koseri]|uniref:Uncharacterized protein n=1 Tax=Citrobacter koseri TaxID=545 RepID=A0A447UJE3_CITKO|nr:Uncharacterised protein [Citrobacter koseri]
MDTKKWRSVCAIFTTLRICHRLVPKGISGLVDE